MSKSLLSRIERLERSHGGEPLIVTIRDVSGESDGIPLAGYRAENGEQFLRMADESDDALQDRAAQLGHRTGSVIVLKEIRL